MTDAEISRIMEGAVNASVEAVLNSDLGKDARATLALARALALHAGVQMAVSRYRLKISDGEMNGRIIELEEITRRAAAHELIDRHGSFNFNTWLPK